MHDGHGAGALTGQLDELAVEGLPAELLEVAGARAALLDSGPLLLR
jgi:hypothetical protein